MKKTFVLMTLGLAVLATSSSCKKKETPQAVGTLVMHVHTFIDTAQVVFGEVRADANGRKMQLTAAKYFLSGFRLKKQDGTWIHVDGYMQKIMDQEEYVLGKVPVGTYTSIGFDLGIDSVTNHLSPSSAAMGSPLAQSTSDSWYGNTTQGYVFLNVTGMADTSAARNGNANFPFSYQIGSDAMRRSVVMPDSPNPFIMYENDFLFVHLYGDYGKLLGNINIAAHPVSTSYTNPVVATDIANAFTTMFIYGE